jgi:hypothetical protein
MDTSKIPKILPGTKTFDVCIRTPGTLTSTTALRTALVNIFRSGKLYKLLSFSPYLLTVSLGANIPRSVSCQVIHYLTLSQLVDIYTSTAYTERYNGSDESINFQVRA